MKWSEAALVGGGLVLGAAFVTMGPEAVVAVMALTLAALSAVGDPPASAPLNLGKE